MPTYEATPPSDRPSDEANSPGARISADVDSVVAAAREAATGAAPPTKPGAYTAKAAYNVSAASLAVTLIAAAAGFAIASISSSSATLGYALENCVDAVGSMLVLWRFEGGGDTITEAQLELREKRAGIGIAAMFVVLGIVVASKSAAALAANADVDGELMLLALSLPSFVVFAAMGVFKVVIADAVDSPALRKDAWCTLSGAVLSLGVLLSYCLQVGAGIWWADGVIAVAVGAVLFGYGAAVLRRNRGLRWWSAVFWSEGRSRAALKRDARAALGDLGADGTGSEML